MRKRLIILSCFILFIPDQLFGQDKNIELNFTKGNKDGIISASQNYSAGGWFAKGAALGFVLPIIGIGISAGASQSGDVFPPDAVTMLIKRESLEYQSGFYLGYSKKAKSKKLLYSFVGSFVGTGFTILLLSSK